VPGKKPLLGAVRTAFELHSFHGDQWLHVREARDLRELEPAAALLIERQEVDGIRIVRRTDYEDHGFRTTVTFKKRLRPGVQELDPLLRANPGRDASWCDQPADFHGDVQRQVMRGLFAKYLDERRLTPLEVLNYEVHAKALDNAGTTVQGALQRLASQQVRGGQGSAVTRMKELMALADQALQQLTTFAKANPVPALAPGGLKDLAARLAAEPGDPMPKLYRAVAAYLQGTKCWVEKLDRLFQLFQPDLTVREMRVLDSVASEIMASPLALKELAGDRKTRFELVTNAIDLYAGNLASEGGEERPAGVQTMSRLLAEGLLPRTIAELRLGLLRHLFARVPFRPDRTGLRDEIRASVEVLDYLRKAAPGLAADEEVGEALATRIDKLIQPEAMSELLALGRGTMGKVELLLGLIESAPGASPKAKMAPYLRSLIVPDDIIRDHGGKRVDALKPLSAIARRISAAGMPDANFREMVDILDTAMFETIRTEILSNQALPFADRMLALIRHCADLPEGRARQLASENLTQAMRRPEFILTYLERFASASEKRDAYFKLCDALVESGLVSPSLVPTNV